ncbi:MAG: D-sedoheptulose 7-phosphate isomerase [Deltaproteobacteria bacterium]|nr:D-sedoheptulose 7-phosphate isomerase [Deltaproteobacteria bacterium]
MGAPDGTIEAAIARVAQSSLEAHRRFAAEAPGVLAEVAAVLLERLARGGKLLVFGNGGSAADAQHVAAELVGRFSKDRPPIPAIALTTDTSALTAISNDWDYREVFARQVRALAQKGDVVVGISTSGNSPNVHRGLIVARELGAVTIGFTGARGQALRALTDINFEAPSEVTSHIQELHILAWHSICQVLDDRADWL